jgi:glycerol-3-phosphate cytidylyltransferase
MFKTSKINLKRPHVFVPMAADIMHYGHINILKKSKKYGSIIVGLMTDKGIKSYKKKYPFMSYKERKIVLESLKYVDCVIPIPGLKYVEFAKKYKFNFFIHGDDWKKGPQSHQRSSLIKIMKKWGGKVIDIKYTKGVSSSLLKKKFKNEK